MRERLGILISGGGTTMAEIIKACKSGEIPIDVALVISSTPTAGGIEKAQKLGLPDQNIVVVNPDDFLTREEKVFQYAFGLQLLKQLTEHNVTVVTQNGWMPLTPRIVINEYPRAIFNQHPGPVPEFGGKGMYGRRVHAARLLFTRLTGRDNWTEAIAQRMHGEYDQGSVIKAIRVNILPGDTVDDLQQRVLPIEHRVQIELLKDIARGDVRELMGREKLVRPGEEQTLILVKKIARLMYPHG